MKNNVFILLIFLGACASGARNSSTSPSMATDNNPNTFSPNDAALSLADYLKRVPGVQVMKNGSDVKVTVRGTNSLNGPGEPLFIINGVNVGSGYENAEPLVAVTDIATVQVLKSGQETAPYGMQGSNGVIVIKTKK